jgi:hypothetical protein
MSLSVRALIEAFQAPDLQTDGEYELRSYAAESSLVFAVAEHERTIENMSMWEIIWLTGAR